VSSNYFRGAEPDDEQYATLAAVGIKTVIDLRSDDFDTEDRLLVERAGMKYVQIPMTTHEPPTQSSRNFCESSTIRRISRCTFIVWAAATGRES
jgi:protein tyrosine phosphatase (PTP) superfamily phosphohydrolase (DUF442 family)